MPDCNHLHYRTHVLYAHKRESWVYRRWYCTECGERFSTQESMTGDEVASKCMSMATRLKKLDATTRYAIDRIINQLLKETPDEATDN